jgi:UDP-glucose 4-epimerase
MRVLITGANGFIGSYLANYFLQKKYAVIASSRHINKAENSSFTNARVIEIDVINNELLQNLQIQADVLIHVATANDIVSKNTKAGIELSTIGTKNMLEFAFKNSIPKCIVFSTFQVYGMELTGLITESTPLHFLNDYGANHLFAEIIAEQYHRMGKVKCAIVRPSNVFGEILSSSFNRWNLIPGCFCKEAVGDNKITIKSSGLQMRNFVHLENLAFAIDCICNDKMNNFETYNIGSTESYTMLEVAKMVKKIMLESFNKDIEISVEGNTPIDTNNFTVSLEKLKGIGFIENKEFNLEKGISQIFNYLQNDKHEPN